MPLAAAPNPLVLLLCLFVLPLCLFALLPCLLVLLLCLLVLPPCLRVLLPCLHLCCASLDPSRLSAATGMTGQRSTQWPTHPL
jgi:hypothetical protein